MKIAFCRALLFSLAIFISNGFGQGNYGQPNGYIPRYPLGQTGNSPANPQAYNRNAIQQPQLYRAPIQTQRVAPVPSIPVQRVFTPGAAQPRPYVASNYPYGYQDKAPMNNPVSPSELPIPGNNRQLEQMPPIGVQQAPGVVQQPMHAQQNQVQPYQPGLQQNYQVAPGYPMGQQQGQVYQHAPSQYEMQNQIHAQPVHADQLPYNAGCNDPGNGYANNYGGQLYNAPNGYGPDIYGGYQPCAVAPLAPARNMWFGSIGGLVFHRDFEDDKLLAYPLGMPRTKSLLSTDADPGAMGGVEAIFGRRFCNGYGIQVNYWGLFSEVGVAEASGGNPQTTWHTSSYLSYNPGGGANMMDTYLNAATSFRARRTNEFHNIELNFLKYTTATRNYNCNPCGNGCGGGGFGRACGLGCNPCGQACGQSCGQACGQACGSCGIRGGCGCFGANPRPFSFDLLAGVRFFKFDENFFFRTSTAGDYVSNVNDMYYDTDVENNLVGLQLGGNINYCICPRWKLVGGTRFGVYGNSINQRQQIYGLAGYAYANTGAYVNQDYNIQTTKTDVAFLGQLDLGLEYCITQCWSVGFGYRVISVTGVALAPNQIPYDYSDYAEAGYIDSNSSLILHGGYARLQYNF